MLSAPQATAFDFSSIAPSGQTLYYNIYNGNAQVTHQLNTDNPPYYRTYPTGDLTIPSTVTYNGTTYSVTSIGEWAFRNCSGLTSVIIPNSVTSIGRAAFGGCTGLTSFTIPNSVTSIDIYAFRDCNGLTSLTIPNSVYSIGNSAFDGCSGLTTVNFNATNCTMMGNPNEPVFGSCTSLTTLNIGDNVLTIPDYAFYYCPWLTSVIIPDSVTNIGNCAFHECSRLTSLTIGNSVSSIGDSAFQNCTGLTSITIPNSVTTIGQYAFQNCTSLTSLNLCDTIYEIKSYAFSGCTSLTSVTIPTSVRYIRGCVFADCTGLTTVNFNATILGWMGSTTYPTFSNCTSFTTLNIGNNVQKIPDYAFYGCAGLTSVTIPNSVTRIGTNAFQNCTGLTSVTIPNSVTDILTGAFRNCTGLTSITIPNSITRLHSYVFQNCTGLTSFSIPNTVTSIEPYAFSGCTGLTSITIPNTDSIIGNRAFYGCTGLTSVTLGGSLSKIGYLAFGDCVGITEIHSLSRSVPQCVMANGYTTNYAIDSVFYGVSSDIPIYVPCGYINNYSRKWTYFSNFNEDFYAVNAYSADQQMGSAEVTRPYSCDNRQPQVTATANEGYMFDHWSNGVADNPYTLRNIYSDTTLVAYFYLVRTLSVSTDNTTMGYVVGGGAIRDGWSVSIFAEPNYGYHFSHWNDGNTDNPRTITIIQDTSFTAFFEPNQYTLTLQSNNETFGAVSGNGTYNYLDTVLIKAYPADHCHFVCWSDNNTDNPRYYVVNSDDTLGAIFDHDPLTLTVDVNNDSYGSVSGSGNYNYNTTPTITAYARYGYHFTNWNDSNTDNPRIITLTQDSAFTAFFEKNQYTLTLHCNDASLGNVCCGGTYLYLDTALITASPANYCHFVRWGDNNTDNPRRYVITRTQNLDAIFAYDQFSITLNTNNDSWGTVSGGGSYDYNSTHTITAVANYGYHFSHWSDGNTNNPRTVTVTGDATYTAYFEINQYTVSVVPNNTELGSVTGGGTFDHGTTITISAEAIANYHFTQWQDANTDNPRTVTVTDNATYTAFFEPNQYTVTVVSDNTEMGSVSGSGTFDYSTSITISAETNYGYHFTQWQDGNTDNPRTVTVTCDTTYTAFFEADDFVITVLSDDPSMGTVSGGGIYAYGSTITITAIPVDGYMFAYWQDDNNDNPRYITVTGDAEYVAHFYRPEGIDDVEATDNIKVYTLGNTIVIDFSGQQTAGSSESIVVYDMLGRVIKTDAIKHSSNQTIIPVSGMGIYMVKIGDQPSRKVLVRP